MGQGVSGKQDGGLAGQAVRGSCFFPVKKWFQMSRGSLHEEEYGIRFKGTKSHVNQEPVSRIIVEIDN